MSTDIWLQGLRAIVLLALLIAVPAQAPGQPQSDVDDSGFNSLPERGKWLLGAAREPAAYMTLTSSQRATYEAIIHALDRQKLLTIVDAVTAIWGGEDLPSSGRDDFRISVVLDPNALSALWNAGFDFDGRGHVKLASGNRARDSSTDSARGPGELPRLHVSWLRNDPRIGEIDIDYREGFFGGHLSALNSDIRASWAEIPHYCMHRAKYDSRLVNWWNQADGADIFCDPQVAPPREGWAQLGRPRMEDEWVFNGAQSLEPRSRIRANEEVGIYRIFNRDIPVYWFMPRGACASLMESNEHKYPGELWIKVREADCE